MTALLIDVFALIASLVAMVYSSFFAIKAYMMVKKVKNELYYEIEETISEKAENYVKGHILTQQHIQAQAEKSLVADYLDSQTQGALTILEAVSPRFAKKIVSLVRKNPEMAEAIIQRLKSSKTKEEVVREW